VRIVAVSQRIDDYPDRGERRDALDQALVRFLLACGCLALPLPNALLGEAPSGTPCREAFDEWTARVRPEGVLLSGGNDPGGCPDRDSTESLLMEYAEGLRLPLLGICRGMQMMGLRAGASLVRVEGHVRTRHELHGERTGVVNSFHNFALSKCPEDYTVPARSGDGVPEAIRHVALPWEGWMWHPEREPLFCAMDIERARRLFDA